MIERINAYLAPITVDYQRDVLPLTPAGNATERHILTAYTKAAETRLHNPVPFWAEKLKLTEDQISAQISNTPAFHNTIRAKIMKRGGVGYAQPEAGTFPSIEEVTRMITACQALPCATWLDGTTPGEQAMPELLELLIGKGVVSLNIVPDRNWNIIDTHVLEQNIKNLYQVVELARQLDLPLNIGTEMNAYGQKLIDDFDAPELAPVRADFIEGAYFIYGHTMMQRALGWGYQSQWAQAFLPARRERNAFYASVGRLVDPMDAGLARLKQAAPDDAPAQILSILMRD
jgi:hypothetical protein